MTRTGWTDADQEAFDALADNLIERACDIADRFPLGSLTAQQRELLIGGFDWSEISGDALIQRWAQAVGSRPDIRSIDPAHRSLGGFRRKGAANRRQRLAQEENAIAVAEASMRRRNRPSARGAPQEGLTPDQMINTSSQALKALGYLRRDRAGRLWYDDFCGHIKLDWRGDFDTTPISPAPLDDDALGRILVWLRSVDPDELGNTSDRVLEKTIRDAADLDHRNEPREWLEGLTWDGVERLPNMLHRIFRAPDTKLNRYIGGNLLIGMVARILKPGCKLDTMVVLRGGQGLNKSTACEVLGGRWYAQTHASVDSKDFLLDLKGRAVIELPELHSFVRTASGAARIKATLSSASDLFRVPYDRAPKMHDRTAVLIGTTNDRTFHSDPTGGRRFMVVDTPQLIDITTLRAERDQLFAEAVVKYRAGATWWEFPEEEHREMLESATAVSTYQELLESWLQGVKIYDGTDPAAPAIAATDETQNGSRIPVSWGTMLTSWRAAQALGMAPKDLAGGPGRYQVAECLRAMGFTQYVIRVKSGGPVRFWLKVRPVDLSVTKASSEGTEAELPF